MLSITYKDIKTNIWVRERTKVIDIMNSMRKMKWSWAGHTNRIKYDRLTSVTIFRIIDYNVFEAIGVSEISLTYFSIVFGGFTFGTGITFADFHVSGRDELLKFAVKGPARILA